MSEPGLSDHDAPDSPVLEAVSLIRDFGPVRAVDHVSFRLGAGELLAVFGPNGAGKTSLLRLLGGGMRPTSGEVRVGGQRLTFGDRSAQARIGVLSHQSFLYGHLTAEANLRFYGRLYGLPALDELILQRLADVGLDYADIVKTTIFMADIDDYPEINRIYAGYFDGDPPARSAVQAAALPGGFAVEIEVVAARTGLPGGGIGFS